MRAVIPGHITQLAHEMRFILDPWAVFLVNHYPQMPPLEVHKGYRYPFGKDHSQNFGSALLSTVISSWLDSRVANAYTQITTTYLAIAFGRESQQYGFDGSIEGQVSESLDEIDIDRPPSNIWIEKMRITFTKRHQTLTAAQWKLLWQQRVEFDLGAEDLFSWELGADDECFDRMIAILAAHETSVSR